jgi:hypothetical protein
MCWSLRDRLSQRKRQLFAVACCRRLQWLLPSAFRRAIDRAEILADGACTAEQLDRIYEHLVEAQVAAVRTLHLQWERSAAAAWAGSFVGRRLPVPETTLDREHQRLGALAEAIHDLVRYFTDSALCDHAPTRAAKALALVASESPAVRRAVEKSEREEQNKILRDVAGEAVIVQMDAAWRAWHGGMVGQLAAAIYHDRAFDRLPILGDALEDAGCHETTILDHCRGSGEHARGCWVVDFLLNKT